MSKLDWMASWYTLCCVLGGLGLAQSAPQAESGTTIHATVNEVALDLVVRDKKGRLVKTLKPGDVEIYEDGVRQEIRSLRLVVGPPPAAPQQPAAQLGTPTAATEAEEPAPIQPSALPLRSVSLVCIVFHNLDSLTRKWAVAAAQDFIKNELRPNTFVGVFNLDSRLTPLQAFSTNREELLRAAGVRLDRAGAALLYKLRHYADTPFRVTSLAALLGVDAPTVTRKVQQLERLGYVAREPDPEDGRASLIRLTRSGQDTVDRILAAHRDRLARLFDGWGDDDVRTFGALLEKFSESLRRDTEVIYGD